MKNISVIILLLVMVALANLLIGSVMIPPKEALMTILGMGDKNEIWSRIIFDHRLPRVITAVMAGSSLSICGLYMQTFFRNPLAGPYVLGVSAGASLGIAVLVLGSGLFGAYFIVVTSKLSMVIASVLGASLVFIVIIIFSKSVNDHTSLLIIGLMFSSATSALVSVLQFFSTSEDIQSYLMWTFGDLASVTNSELYILVPIILIGWIGSMFLVKTMNIYLLGDQYARNAGLNIVRSRYLIISLTALMSGTVTAFCGPIAFIGLATPHIARMIINDADHRKLLPYSAIIGSGIMLVCDIISRLPGLPQTLPLNAVTSILGGPLVIYLIVKKNNLQQSF
ncbi:MAG: iron ABC transporter permease [Reichenbachiella sp.]